MSLRPKICRDLWETWSVHGLSAVPVGRLPSLSAGLDYVRRECAAAPATIELAVDGLCVVVHQEDGWPHPLVAPEAERPRPAGQATGLAGRSSDVPSGRYPIAGSRQHPLITIIERIAERIAEGIIPIGPIFWLLLLLSFVAVKLGIIPTSK